MATENKLNKRNKKMENKQSIEISHQALNSNLNEILQGLKNLNSKGTPKVIQSIGSIKYNNLLQDKVKNLIDHVNYITKIQSK